MKIQVFYFAQLRDFLQKESQTLEFPDGTTVGELARWLVNQPGWEALRFLPLLKAVNEEFAGDHQQLRSGDKVALLPPVAGG